MQKFILMADMILIFTLKSHNLLHLHPIKKPSQYVSS